MQVIFDILYIYDTYITINTKLIPQRVISIEI